jgi:hypothetical protein
MQSCRINMVYEKLIQNQEETREHFPAPRCLHKHSGTDGDEQSGLSSRPPRIAALVGGEPSCAQ